MRRTDIIAAGLAAALALGAAFAPAAAYLTGSVTAKADVSVAPLSVRTELNEPIVGLTKQVTITREGDSAPVWVRVRLVAGDTVAKGLQVTGDDWSYDEDDGWWYYGIALDGDPNTTSTLSVTVDGETVPADALDGEKFNVVVIHECAPVLYDEEGNEIANWGLPLDTSVVDPLTGE